MSQSDQEDNKIENFYVHSWPDECTWLSEHDSKLPPQFYCTHNEVQYFSNLECVPVVLVSEHDDEGEYYYYRIELEIKK